MSHILVVDDDADICGMLKQLLEIEGYNVRTARNGSEALKRLRSDEGSTCMILLDLMMPVMNGWDTYNALARDPALAPIPVVLLSGDPALPEKQAALGAAGYLQKPVDLTALLEMVGRHCPHPPPG